MNEAHIRMRGIILNMFSCSYVHKCLHIIINNYKYLSYLFKCSASQFDSIVMCLLSRYAEYQWGRSGRNRIYHFQFIDSHGGWLDVVSRMMFCLSAEYKHKLLIYARKEKPINSITQSTDRIAFAVYERYIKTFYFFTARSVCFAARNHKLSKCSHICLPWGDLIRFLSFYWTQPYTILVSIQTSGISSQYLHGDWCICSHSNYNSPEFASELVSIRSYVAIKILFYQICISSNYVCMYIGITFSSLFLNRN